MVNSEAYSSEYFSELSPCRFREPEPDNERDSDVTEETESGDTGDTSL